MFVSRSHPISVVGNILLLLVVLVACSNIVASIPRQRGNVQKVEGVNALKTLFLGTNRPKNRSSSIKIIGAGLPKTGTKAMQYALETLGHSIYDPFPLGENLTHAALLNTYIEAIDSGNDTLRKKTFDAFHEAVLEYGATATLDAPMCWLFEELLERNPDAKVILMTRVTGGKNGWAKSCNTTLTAVSPLSGWPFTLFARGETLKTGSLDMLQKIPGAFTLNAEYWNPWWAPWIHLCTSWTAGQTLDELASCYDKHNQHVREVVPEDQLLEFTAADGWEPLCNFLEVPDEDCPLGDEFPRVNSRKTIGVVHWTLRFIAVAYPFIVLTPLLLLYWCVKQCCCCCCCCCCRRRRSAIATPTEKAINKKQKQN